MNPISSDFLVTLKESLIGFLNEIDKESKIEDSIIVSLINENLQPYQFCEKFLSEIKKGTGNIENFTGE